MCAQVGPCHPKGPHKGPCGPKHVQAQPWALAPCTPTCARLGPSPPKWHALGVHGSTSTPGHTSGATNKPNIGVWCVGLFGLAPWWARTGASLPTPAQPRPAAPKCLVPVPHHKGAKGCMGRLGCPRGHRLGVVCVWGWPCMGGWVATCWAGAPCVGARHHRCPLVWPCAHLPWTSLVDFPQFWKHAVRAGGGSTNVATLHGMLDSFGCSAWREACPHCPVLRLAFGCS